MDLNVAKLRDQGDEVEENKQEPINMHNDYKDLFKSNILAKIGQTFTDDQIKAFFDDFLKDVHQYELKDKEITYKLYKILD